MALTRKMLKAMGIEEEKIDQIIEAHSETVDSLKADRDSYKKDADQLKSVREELDELKAKGDDGWKEKHDKLKGEFDKYKGDIEAKETKANKEKAVRAFYESKGITGKNLEIAMRGSRAEIDGIELDGDKIKDNSALDALVKGDFSGLVATTTTKGANTANPPANNGNSGVTKEDFRKMSYKDRLQIYNENPDLYNELTT